jgi:dihydropteroate synthase
MEDRGNLFPQSFAVGDNVFDFSKRSYVMGILNVTPDSFSDGARFYDLDAAIKHGMEMAEQGADIIDVGGESTRPGADTVSADEEIQRTEPVIRELSKRIDIPLSIDTTKADVARRALDAGAEIVNDISALRADPEMVDVAVSYQAPVVLMHMLGSPKTMQQDICYNSIIEDITNFLKERIDFAINNGVERNKIIIDPGIGFGKSVGNDNFEIIREMRSFASLGLPVLVGPSRKAFIGRLLDAEVDERDIGTLATVSIAIHNGANIVRVHNVAQTKMAAKVADSVIRAKS